MAEDHECNDNCKAYSVEDALLEKSRLEVLQQVTKLSEADEAILSILNQWLSHYAGSHTNQA